MAVDGKKDGEGFKMEGRVKGIAKLIDSKTGVFTGKDMKLFFYFKSQSIIEIQEKSKGSTYYHGSGICFSGIYEKDI